MDGAKSPHTELTGEPEWQGSDERYDGAEKRDVEEGESKGAAKYNKRPVMELVFPSTIPVTRGGKDEGGDEHGGGAQAGSALYACFPGVFSSATSARRACRRGGSLQAFWPLHKTPGEGVDRLRLGKLVTGADIVRGGDRVLLVVLKGPLPENFKDSLGRNTEDFLVVESGGERQTPNVAWNQPLEVLVEDEHYAVIVKPPALLTHKSFVDGGDVKEFLPRSLKVPAATEDNVPTDDALEREPFEPSPCHRLDVGTGGAMIISKTRQCANDMRRQFENKRVNKVYTAVVCGRIDKSGVIEGPMSGQHARTEYAPIRYVESAKYGHLTMVELKPITGRQHQLRRHMAQMETPIVGDKRYRGTHLKGKTPPEDGWLMLWATRIQFKHPVTGNDLDVTAPFPRKFDRFMDRQQATWDRQQMQSKEDGVVTGLAGMGISNGEAEGGADGPPGLE